MHATISTEMLLQIFKNSNHQVIIKYLFLLYITLSQFLTSVQTEHILKFILKILRILLIHSHFKIQLFY